MVQTIDSYFNSLEDTIKIRVKESAAVLKQMDSIHHRMRQILEELAALDDKLQGNTQATVPTIRRVFSLDGNGLSQTFMMELNNYAGIRKRAHIDISFDEGKFRQGLADCVSFEKQMMTQRSMKPTNILVPPSPRPPHPVTPTSQHSHMQFNQFARSDNELIIRDKLTLGAPTLHFFEGCSKNLHLISLPSLTRQMVTLRSSYQIPQHHKSICTSTNQLIISGGLFDEHTKNRFVGKYDLQKKTFNDQFAVVLERSSHSLCELDGFVYIIGGLGTEGEGQRNVQRVNIKTGQVENETPSKYSGNNVCVALTNTKQIVKLCLEGIQIYQATRRVWTTIVVPNYLYYQSCAAIDINDNQIFVFGGYNNLVPEAEKGVTASHTFDITDRSNINIGNINKFALPIAEGFWNNVPTIYKRQIYALQNIQNQQSQDCMQNERNVLRFDGVTWSVL